MIVPEWLAHRPRDRRGLPIPYVNRYGPETPPRIEHDQYVGGRAVFIDDVPGAPPDFTRQHMGRQRECMMAGLCQVCGRRVPWSRRFLVVAEMSVERIVLGARQAMVVTEPWLDARCLDLALANCPALIRRTRADELSVVAITFKQQVRLVVSRGWVDGPLEEETRRTPVMMWTKVYVLGGVK